jgi:hypothetical protein
VSKDNTRNYNYRNTNKTKQTTMGDPTPPTTTQTTTAPKTTSKKRNILILLTIIAIVAFGLTLGLVFREQDTARSAASSDSTSGEDTDGQENVGEVEEVETAPTTWPHEESDIPKDPELRLGQLDNGMKYMILRHPWPSGMTSMRLHIDAGSFHEDDDQLG